MSTTDPIPVIDLFAGPGGLSEGFSSIKSADGRPVFKIRLSIEKDPSAHQTLELRAFFRQFHTRDVPDLYYRHLRGECTRDELFAAHPAEANCAGEEAWRAELGVAEQDATFARIASALKGSDPDNWILIGGPPCQAYSLVGRSRNKGIKHYEPDSDIRQTLYVEYLQIIADHWPRVFVLENVKGLLSATHRGQRIFDRIRADLQEPAAAIARENRERRSSREYSYRLYSLAAPRGADAVDAASFVVRSELHGVPQKRHRIILIGVREPARVGTALTLPTSSLVPARCALEGLPRLRSGVSGGGDSVERWKSVLGAAGDRRFLKAVSSHAGEDVSEVIASTIASLVAPRAGRGAEFIRHNGAVGFAPAWFLDDRLGGVCNHSTRAHMPSDLLRYLYVSCFGRLRGYSPGLVEFPAMLQPAHANISRAPSDICFADRFRVQLPDRPSTTITSHASKDGHYYIHPDPTQCRSLTVREAARLQTFPDNYFFCGPRTAQYGQVGNAVPPLLARAIASVVWESILAE